MSIIVSLPKQLEKNNDMIRRFAPFQSRACKLPDCSILFHILDKQLETNKAKRLLADLLECDETEIKDTVVNEFHFAPSKNGVAIWEDRPILVIVYENWKTIIAFMTEAMQYSRGLQTLLLRAYQYTALYSGALMIHAAAIEFRNEGILFCGVPSAGKSTQARLWERVYEAEAINNDQPCIIYIGDRAFVSGTPWSGKEPCYKNICVPIRAIVFVEKSLENRVISLSQAEAYSYLYLNEYVIPMYDDTEQLYGSAIKKLVNSVPILRLYCTKREDAAQVLYDSLNY